jgi:hypothetical protein
MQTPSFIKKLDIHSIQVSPLLQLIQFGNVLHAVQAPPFKKKLSAHSVQVSPSEQSTQF